ncbi:MAG: cold-shock protein, partial [Sphingomicrobium sp.]
TALSFFSASSSLWRIDPDAPDGKDPRMPDGTVKFFNKMKGFGFITQDGGGPDAFVHISAVEAAGLGGLEENQRVSFELEPDRRGRESAANIKLL